MAGDETAGTDSEPNERRRRLLGYLALAGFGASGVAGAWYATRPEESSQAPPEATPTTDTPRETETEIPTETSDMAVPRLVQQFAPDLYFGRLEKWYPTDPREYVVDADGKPVVDGFTALEAYSASVAETGRPPNPMVFYNVVSVTDDVDAIQYWLYSVFDQFTVNFHWHDWELLQVFVDRDTEEPLLVSASAHSRKVPNNEFLTPVLADGRRPGVLSEVGSHSSASEVNAVVPSFERVETADWTSDVTNDVVDVSPQISAPFAYGLPRDEGARLPFVMPELDGNRLDQHPDLSVTRGDFIDESVTVDAWHGLARPPTDLPTRQPGLVLAHPDSPVQADVRYELEPISAVRAAVDDFVGPQLSFEFAVPGFVEEQLAGHITSVGIPWEQERFDDPLADVTDPLHRQRIDGATPSGLRDRVVGRVRQLGAGTAGALDNVAADARDALVDTATVSLFGLPVEVVARLASENPVTSATRSGVFAFLHVESGAHVLTITGPGFAPVAERFVHDGGLQRVGGDGELLVVPAADAGWVRGDGRDTTGVERVRVTEDYAGVVFDGRPVEEDRFAVAVHRDGHYTVDVTDSDGRPGSFRVTPDRFEQTDEVRFETLETGKLSLTRALRDRLADLDQLTRRLTERDDASVEVLDRVGSAREASEAALRDAQEGLADNANEHLERVVATLDEALGILQGERQGGFSDASATALGSRIRDVIDRAEQAIETSLA